MKSARQLRKKRTTTLLVARSTMLPGSVEDVILKELGAASGKRVGVDFGVAMNPEFLRESTSVYDFFNPPMTVIRQYDEKIGNLLEKMYHFLDAPIEKTDIKTAGTDDLRESPLVILVESLIGKEFDIKIFDKNVSLARLVGANKDYIEKEIPHISKLMTGEIDDIIQHSDLIVTGNKAEEASRILEQVSDDAKIYDLVRVSDSLDGLSRGYEGVCW